MKTEAGFKLDQLIAEKVMGLEVSDGRYKTRDCDIDDHCRDEVVHWDPVLPYSTDIKRAFEVHKHLGRLMRLTDFGPFAWHCELLGVQPGQVDVEAKAESASLAICLAALLAVNSNEKEGGSR